MPDEQQNAAVADFDWQNDADFHALPMNEKHKALLEVMPGYKSLPGSEQVKALNEIHYGADWKPKEEEPKGVTGSLKRTLSFPSSLYHSFADAATPEEQEHFNNLAKEENAEPHKPGGFELGYYRNIEHPGHDIRAAGGHERSVGTQNLNTPPPVTETQPSHVPGVFGRDEAAVARKQVKGASQWLSGAADTALGVTPVVGPFIHSIGERIEPALTGHPEKGDFTGGLADIATAHVAENAGSLARLGKQKFNEFREPARLEKGSKSINEGLDTPPGKAGERAAQMDKAVADAQADLAELGRTTKRAKGAEAYRSFVEKTEERQQKMWDEGHNKGIDRHAEALIDHDSVRNAGERVLANREAVENAPEEAAAAKKWLDSVSKERGLKSADNLIREINADLNKKASTNQPYSELQTRMRVEVVKELRNQVERTLDASGEKGVKDVNRRWGALDKIKDRAAEQAIALARKESKQGVLPDWAKLYMITHPGIGTALGVGVNLGKLAKPNLGRTFNRGLRTLGKTSLEAPYEATPPERWGAPPVGLLQAPKAPAVEAPYRAGADVSGALSRDEQQGRWTTPRGLLERYPEQRANRLLPAPAHGEVAINATPDASEVLPAEPATNVQRTKSGRMQRVYEGTAKPRIIGQTADGGPIYEHTPAVERSEQAISHEPIDKIKATRSAKERGVKGGAPSGIDRRSSVRDIQGPDFIRTARANQLRALLADPALPDDDRAIIEAQLDDLRAHPFEKHEGGDINSMKKERRLSREEAEKNSEERKKGRSARFEDIKLKPRNESKIAIEGIDAAHSQEHDRIKIDPFTERYQKNLRKRKLQRA